MRPLKIIFNDWAKYAYGAYLHKQWLLSKWEIHDGIDWPHSKIELLFKTIRESLQLKASDSLIDIGCGGGWIRNGLRPYVKQALGLDLSMEMLKNAKMVAPGERNNFICGDVCHIPFQDESFDCALCYFVLVNFENPDDMRKAVLEVMRILKQGGRVLIGQIPDRNYSAQYDRAKKDYLEYCRKNFPVGTNIRDVCLVPVHPLGRGLFIQLLEEEKITYQVHNSFNPFYRAGQSETVGWRFDLILEKKK